MGVRGVRRIWARCGRLLSTSAASRLSNAELLQKRSKLFDQEKARQQTLVPRIEKIEVKHVGKPEPGAVFIMNKGLSTPYNCAMHISNWCVRRSILALVDGEVWDMYKPLEKSCDIQFLTFTDENPEAVNQAYWRSCAMMMGYVLETAFKDEYAVELIRAPEIPVIAGAFCYDVILDSRLDDWTPSQENLQSLTQEAYRLIHKDLPFELLEVPPKVAREIFEDNKHKLEMIEERASHHPRKLVKLYRCGDFVDVSDGPHISRTGICSQYEITAAHNLGTSQSSLERRFQGLSIPLHLKIVYSACNEYQHNKGLQSSSVSALQDLVQDSGATHIRLMVYKALTFYSVWGRLRQRSQKLVTADRNHTDNRRHAAAFEEIGGRETQQERVSGLL